MSRIATEEFKMIKENMVLDTERMEITFTYLLLQDPSILGDNRQPATSMAYGLKKRHGVTKPELMSTNLRIVLNSSLDNYNQGTSYKDIMPKGPNALMPLVKALTTFQSDKNAEI